MGSPFCLIRPLKPRSRGSDSGAFGLARSPQTNSPYVLNEDGLVTTLGSPATLPPGFIAAYSN
jgi:hypothetical protein